MHKLYFYLSCVISLLFEASAWIVRDSTRIKRKKKTTNSFLFYRNSKPVSEEREREMNLNRKTLRLTKDNIVNQLNGYINERFGYNKNVFSLHLSLTLMMIKLTFESAIEAGARSHKHAQTKATAKRWRKIDSILQNDTQQSLLRPSIEMKISMCHSRPPRELARKKATHIESWNDNEAQTT